MLKAYAVALVLSTATPVADKGEDAHKAAETKQPVATQWLMRPRKIKL